MEGVLRFFLGGIDDNSCLAAKLFRYAFFHSGINVRKQGIYQGAPRPEKVFVYFDGFLWFDNI